MYLLTVTLLLHPMLYCQSEETDGDVVLQGAGHMVPQWAPGPALHMFESFITSGSF